MHSPLRVAQVMGKMNGGGVEQVVMNYYHNIDRSKVQFDFLVDADSTLVPEDEIDLLGGRVFRVPPYQHIVSYQRELTRLFRDFGWPIIHSHLNALSVFPLRAARRAGVAARIAHSHSASGGGERIRNTLKTALRSQSTRYPTHYMACSKHAGEWLFGNEVNFQVIYNAINLQSFSFDADLRARVRADLGLHENQYVIGHVGRFAPAKNHRFLIEVFSEVIRHRDDAILLLVGSGKLEASVKSWTAERGISERVKFLGQRDDINRLYQAFDVLTLPSLYEGLGLVGIEAQCAGLSCLLSNTIPQEVDVTGSVRFLSLDDRAAWIEALRSVKVGERATVHLSDFFDYDINRAAQELTKQYLSIYSDTCSHERSSDLPNLK